MKCTLKFCLLLEYTIGVMFKCDEKKSSRDRDLANPLKDFVVFAYILADWEQINDYYWYM